MFAYPLMAANQMNRKFLLAQLNKEEMEKGNTAGANWAVLQAKSAHDSIQALNRFYNTMLNGKWMDMMEVPPGFCALKQQAGFCIWQTYAENQAKYD